MIPRALPRGLRHASNTSQLTSLCGAVELFTRRRPERHLERGCQRYRAADPCEADRRLCARLRWRNASAHARALPGNTSALVTTARPATALGGANVGSVV